MDSKKIVMGIVMTGVVLNGTVLIEAGGRLSCHIPEEKSKRQNIKSEKIHTVKNSTPEEQHVQREKATHFVKRISQKIVDHVGLKVEIVDIDDKACDKEVKQYLKESLTYYHPERRTLYIPENFEKKYHIFGQDDNSNVLCVLGEAYVDHMMRPTTSSSENNKADTVDSFVHLLNAMKQQWEKDEEQENDYFISPHTLLNARFILDHKGEFDRDAVEANMEKIKKMFGNVFKYYYMNPSVMKQISTEANEYMKLLDN